MQKFIFILFLLSCSILFESCPGSGCIDAQYSFNATSQLIPDYDSIRTGDTIFLTSFIPQILKDQTTGVSVNYSNSKAIGSDLGVTRLENSNSIPIDAVSDFDYFSVIGTIYNNENVPSPNGVQQLTYEEINGHYELKIGIIAKTKGIYYFGIGNGYSNGRNDGHSCEKATFNIAMANTSQHVYYFINWNPNQTLDDVILQHLYCFKVY